MHKTAPDDSKKQGFSHSNYNKLSNHRIKIGFRRKAQENWGDKPPKYVPGDKVSRVQLPPPTHEKRNSHSFILIFNFPSNANGHALVKNPPANCQGPSPWTTPTFMFSNAACVHAMCPFIFWGVSCALCGVGHTFLLLPHFIAVHFSPSPVRECVFQGRMSHGLVKVMPNSIDKKSVRGGAQLLHFQTLPNTRFSCGHHT